MVNASESMRSTTSSKAHRKGQGLLNHEGMPGLDTFYDAYESTTISGRFGQPGRQTWAFQTAVPRPWQKPPNLKFGRHLGPADYDPFAANQNHLMSSSSIGWRDRGRAGPMGSPFDSGRASSQFSSVTAARLQDGTTKQPSKITKEDLFILRSDARRTHLQRNDWGATLSRRVHTHAMEQAQARPPPPKVVDFFGPPPTPPM